MAGMTAKRVDANRVLSRPGLNFEMGKTRTLALALLRHAKHPQGLFLALEGLSKCKDEAAQKAAADPGNIRKALVLWNYPSTETWAMGGTESDKAQKADELIDLARIEGIDLVKVLGAIERYCGRHTLLALGSLKPIIDYERKMGQPLKNKDWVLMSIYRNAAEIAANHPDSVEMVYLKCYPPTHRELIYQPTRIA